MPWLSQSLSVAHFSLPQLVFYFFSISYSLPFSLPTTTYTYAHSHAGTFCIGCVFKAFLFSSADSALATVALDFQWIFQFPCVRLYLFFNRQYSNVLILRLNVLYNLFCVTREGFYRRFLLVYAHTHWNAGRSPPSALLSFVNTY